MKASNNPYHAHNMSNGKGKGKNGGAPKMFKGGHRKPGKAVKC